MLSQLAAHFRSVRRSDEIVARYGGEEFVFCVEAMSPAATGKFAAQMHEAAACAATPYCPPTISIGFGIRFGGSQEILLETLRDADKAL